MFPGGSSSSTQRKTRRPVWDRESWLRKTWSKLKPAIWALGITRFATIAITLGVIWYAWREIRRPVLVIDLISVPKQYEQFGFASSVMSRRVVESIETMERDAEIQARKDNVALLAEQEARVDFEVPGTKLSLRMIVSFIR